MPEKLPSEIVADALMSLTTNGWCQGYSRHPKDGTRCLVGHLEMDKDSMIGPARVAATRMCKQVMGEQYPDARLFHLTTFNDLVAKSQTEIAMIFEKARVALVEQGR